MPCVERGLPGAEQGEAERRADTGRRSEAGADADGDKGRKAGRPGGGTDAPVHRRGKGHDIYRPHPRIEGVFEAAEAERTRMAQVLQART